MIFLCWVWREKLARCITNLAQSPIASISARSRQLPNDLITIDAPDLCARYIGAVIKGVVVGPSPDWMARRLQQAGVRSINNIVDVTNYVMLEYGQPLHAFDYDRLHGNRIVVRRAATVKNWKRSTTSSATRFRHARNRRCRNDRSRWPGSWAAPTPKSSDTTTTLLLESASFDMKSVRRASRMLKLRSDASARFERGVDPNLAGAGIARALKLLLQVSPGAEIVEISDVYPSSVEPRMLTMRFDRIERLIGKAFPRADVERVLTDLEFEPVITGNTLTVTIPTF